MLANSLTLEDEEAVQAELRELQLQTVCPVPQSFPCLLNVRLAASGGRAGAAYRTALSAYEEANGGG